MLSEPINVKILGRSLKISCPPDKKDALNIAIKNITQRIQELKIRTHVTNVEQLIFTTALNISNELEEEKIKTKNHISRIEQHINNIHKKIEQLLVSF